MNPERASSGSQFYIVQGQPLNEQILAQTEQRFGFSYTPEQKSRYIQAGFGTPFLDRQYTVFGYVVEGLDVADKIAAVKVDPNNRPLEDVKMKVSIVE
jgi:peptidyl-prolyl cis-trans isomerase B (cyclophilin B)